MAVFTLASPGNSPGVTTTALAMTYAWGSRVLLAECDPQGGAVLPGFLRGRMQGAPGGLLELARSAARGPDPAVLWKQVISLEEQTREWLLLPRASADFRQVRLGGVEECTAESVELDIVAVGVLGVGPVDLPDVVDELLDRVAHLWSGDEQHAGLLVNDLAGDRDAFLLGKLRALVGVAQGGDGTQEVGVGGPALIFELGPAL